MSLKPILNDLHHNVVLREKQNSLKIEEKNSLRIEEKKFLRLKKDLNLSLA